MSVALTSASQVSMALTSASQVSVALTGASQLSWVTAEGRHMEASSCPLATYPSGLSPSEMKASTWERWCSNLISAPMTFAALVTDLPYVRRTSPLVKLCLSVDTGKPEDPAAVWGGAPWVVVVCPKGPQW